MNALACILLLTSAAFSLADIIEQPLAMPSGTHLDFDPGFSIEPVDCPTEQQRCGSFLCYTPGGDEVCLDDKMVCSKTQKLCGYSCYNDETEQCLDDNVCLKSEVLCGWSCNPASDEKHCVETQYGHYFCDLNQNACGSWGCYSEEEKVCHKDEDLLCNKGEVPCGKYICKKEGEECTKEEEEPWRFFGEEPAEPQRLIIMI